ncbi:MAG: T9SS type A sorting domain-containing protein, partial [Paludibacter sp.]|nr:T9SS type A sorting domain-containing protein [Paludibacter sp.]
KWLGTESSGVFLMSENGQETLKHFTSANSPLLSNDITSISISPKTGEVFIGTLQGLISYQSDASIADSTFNNVHAYPNPVREDFAGQITITGLVENTHIKITDINGNLIYQTKSNGSIATWNGKTSSGKKVKTGIYLAICANEDGTQSAITKIMVIN